MSAERSWDQLVELNEHQEYGEAWLPDREADHPRTLVGTVRGYDQGPVSDFTGDSPWICTIEERTGKLWAIWLNRAVLVSEFERQRPMPDERIVVRYRGQQEIASRSGGAPAHLYAVTVDRERQLPEFLTRPRLDAGEPEPPQDQDVSTYGRPPHKDDAVDVSDADVVEDSGDENIPF